MARTKRGLAEKKRKRRELFQKRAREGRGPPKASRITADFVLPKSPFTLALGKAHKARMHADILTNIAEIAAKKALDAHVRAEELFMEADAELDAEELYMEAAAELAPMEEEADKVLVNLNSPTH
jgi:hypothetical protein